MLMPSRWHQGAANGLADRLNGRTDTTGSRPPRILLFSASVGTGHLRAAEALELALRRLAPEARVRNVDVLSLSTRPFRYCYGQMYVNLVNRAPQVLGFFYNLMDRYTPPERQSHRWDRLRVALEKMSLRPLVCLLQSEPWDLVVNTHFLPGEIIASLYEQKRCRVPQVMVVTDFETHRLWVTQPCAHYCTATEESARYLRCYGVPRGDVSVTGIPIHPAFADELYRALLEVEVPVELVVVTGHNAAALRHLRTLPVPPRHHTTVLGYTRDMDELMTAADLAVSKPGGLTTSEALARGLPLAVVHPVPGQEDRNSDYLLENGAAIKVNHVPTLAFKVTELLRDGERLARLKANARRLGRPQAAFAVAERVLSLLRPGLAPASGIARGGS